MTEQTNATVLRSLGAMKGESLAAEDGIIGRIESFLFDDHEWTIRYVLVDTGRWLSGKLVLVSTDAVRPTPSDFGALEVTITKQQVKDSPPLETDAPVSLQTLEATHGHYGWPVYWGEWPAFAMPWLGPIPIDDRAHQEGEPDDASGERDPHLRSSAEVTGYHVHAEDDQVGHIEDLIADAMAWSIRYLVVDTRNWLPGRKVLVSPRWVERFEFPTRNAVVGLRRSEIEGSPEFDARAPVNREYETRLYDYYGRPTYWQ